MKCLPGASLARAFHRLALPLASYYAVTLALPLANGAAHSSGFVRHALTVLVVPPVAIMLGWAAYRVARALTVRAATKARLAVSAD